MSELTPEQKKRKGSCISKMSDPREVGQCGGQGWAEMRGVCSEGKGEGEPESCTPKPPVLFSFILAGGPIHLCSSSLPVLFVIFLRYCGSTKALRVWSLDQQH